MNELTLADIRQFHAELVIVRSAGVKLEFDTRHASAQGINCDGVDSMRSALHAIETHIAAETTRGRTVEAVLESDPSLPVEYVTALWTWKYTDQSPISFDPIVGISQETCRSAGLLRVATIEPMIWLSVSYFSLVFICLFTGNRFENLAETLRAEPGPTLSIVLLLRSWMPIWIWLAPVFLLVAIWWVWKRGSAARRRLERGVRSSPSSEASRRAGLADHTAELIRKGVPAHQAVELLENVRRSSCSERAPLLDWASGGQEPSPPGDDTVGNDTVGNDTVGGGNTASRMQLAASAYHAVARALTLGQGDRSKLQIVFVLLGGVLVLGVALCVFGPLVELLHYVAGTQGGNS